jgi:D-lactate dehydrogenase
MKPKIVFFDSKPYDIDIFNEVNKELQYDIKFFRYHLTPDNIVLVQGFNTVVVFVNDMITADMIDRLYTYGVKLIALRCSGFNNIDLKAALGKIKVVRVPAYSPHAIAEHTVALMLSLNRKIHRAYYRTRDADFSLHGLLGFDMAGKTAGIIGTGRIGKVLTKILRGFDMNVLAYDKYPDLAFAKEQGIKYTELNELFGNSDMISLNCPLTKETEFIINRDTITLMKPGAMIINTGRGKLIRTSDLIQGLKTGKISAAGLDVYEEESEFFFEDHSDKVLTDDLLARLLTFNNVIITSHQGFFTQEAMRNIAITTMDNITGFFKGEPLVNEVCYKCS